MRFLANENIPGDTVDALRAAGHDVSWVRKDAPGMKDPNILAWAARENRVLLTFDKDFGELARQADLPASCGIVLIRLPLASPASVGKALADRIDERDELAWALLRYRTWTSPDAPVGIAGFTAPP